MEKEGEKNIPEDKEVNPKTKQHMYQIEEGLKVEEVEEVDLEELDLDDIEQACANPGIGYIPFQQVSLLREVIIQTKAVKPLGVTSKPPKDQSRKNK